MVEAPESRHDDDDQVGPFGKGLAAELQTAHAFHVNIDQNDVEVVTLDGVEGLPGRETPGDGVSALAEASFGEFAHVTVVVDDQD
jgi:hypothetical protein